MTPKEALERIIDYGPSSDVGVDPSYFDAIDVLRSLVSQPTMQEVKEFVEQIQANYPGWADDAVEMKGIFQEILDFIDRKRE